MRLANKWGIVFFILGLMCLLYSCFFTGKVKVYEKVKGLNHDLSDTVNILIIHGIGYKAPYYADKLIINICNEMNISGFDIAKKKKIEPKFQSNLNPEFNKGAIYFFELNSNFKKQVVRFYVIHWSPLTYEFKDELVKYDFDKRRSKIIHALKKKIVDENFADIATYMNPDYNQYIQKMVEQAFLLVFRRNPLSTGDSSVYIPKSLNVLSGSFGSKIIFDVFNRNLEWMRKNEDSLNFEQRNSLHYLNRIRQHFKDSIERFLVEKPISFYMLTNQIPLFSIGTQSSSSSEGTDPSYAVNSVENEIRRFSQNIQNSSYFKNNMVLQAKDSSSIDSLRNKQIIVFNDPNDFLSYRIRKEIFGNRTFGISNVSIRNAKVFLPGIIKISNPAKAHENAFSNTKMHKIIAQGAPKTRNVKKWYSELHSY